MHEDVKLHMISSHLTVQPQNRQHRLKELRIEIMHVFTKLLEA